MIQDITEATPWGAVIDEGAISGACRVGNVIARHVSGSVTFFLRVRLLNGREVRVSPDLVRPLPVACSADLTIPPVPPGATTLCDTRGAVL